MSSANPGESAQSLFEMGKRFYVSGPGREMDPALALEYFGKSAALGYSPAQRLLGVMYLDGDILPKDFALARKWLTLASDQGDQLAAYYLAQIYAQGLGVEKDWSLAHCLLSRRDVAVLPEALELRRKLKSELIRIYPNLSRALEDQEKDLRRRLTRRQHRFIPNFLDPARNGDDHREFDTWLSLNLGRISAQEAFDLLAKRMAEYYGDMAKLHPPVPA
ncbi:MAG: sel1 repeat family protein [Deltaproteobacteria bacterium]|jgi:hypothetical protein|nr:sel1 repeat family protein [Deltaproteobacteria bacterium]